MLCITVAIVFKAPRPAPSITRRSRKLLFFMMLFIPFLKLSLGCSAEALGGVGGFSLKKISRGTHKTVEIMPSIRINCKNRAFPLIGSFSDPTIEPGNKNPKATPIGAERVKIVVKIVL